MGPLTGLSIGVAGTADPGDAAAFSGAPASVVHALGTLGAQTHALAGVQSGGPLTLPLHVATGLRLRPRDLRDLRAAYWRERLPAQQGRLMERLRTASYARQIRAAGPLDGIVQWGLELRLPRGARRVTFDDATVAQSSAWPWEWAQALGDGDRALLARRARRNYDDAVTVCKMTHWAARSAVEDFGQDPAKVEVVGLGANHVTAPDPDRDWSRPVLLFVGGDWPRKNGDRIVRVFGQLRERVPGAELHVAGGHPRLDAPGVHAYGPLRLDRPDERATAEGLFRRATMLAMPSLHEPAGIVFAEALAAGIPSIGTTDGGSATIIGDAGIVIDPRSDEALLDAMLKLADPETARAMGERAQARAPLFTWEAVAERLVRAMHLPGVDADALGLAAFLP